MKTLIPLIVALFLSVAVSGCSPQVQSPEEEIRQFIDRGIAAAEDRSAGTLADMIHEQYADRKGFTRQQLVKTLRLYFFRHDNIHLFRKIDHIQLHGTREATVELSVAMAGSVVSEASAWSGLRANVYRFQLELSKDDDWLLRKAEWQRVGLGGGL